MSAADDRIADVFWDQLRKDPDHKDRRMTAWGTKTKTGLAAVIRRLAKDNPERCEEEEGDGHHKWDTIEVNTAELGTALLACFGWSPPSCPMSEWTCAECELCGAAVGVDDDEPNPHCIPRCSTTDEAR